MSAEGIRAVAKRNVGNVPTKHLVGVARFRPAQQQVRAAPQLVLGVRRLGHITLGLYRHQLLLLHQRSGLFPTDPKPLGLQFLADADRPVAPPMLLEHPVQFPHVERPKMTKAFFKISRKFQIAKRKPDLNIS